MAVTDPPSLRFVPSRVEGMPDVAEVVVHPDRLELLSAGRWVTIRFADIARWPRPGWLRRRLHRLGWRAGWLPVADRDWFHRPPDKFFRFYTDPPLTVYMPADELSGGQYMASYFRRVQDVLLAGGFATFDLG